MRFDLSKRSSFLTYTARYCWIMKPQKTGAQWHRKLTKVITQKWKKLKGYPFTYGLRKLNLYGIKQCKHKSKL
jgi:hypothetical protein